MNREQIIEALASALMNYRDASGLWGFERAEHRAAYSLTALEATIPGLADVISGKAYFAPRGIADGTMHVLLEKEFPGFAGLLAGTHVIVPVEPTEAMIDVKADDNGNVDEAVARDCLFHLERMSETCWFIGITFKDGSSHAFWLGREKKSVNVTMHEARPK